MSDSGPPLLATDIPRPCLLPDVVVELQRSVNELSLAAQAFATKKGTSKEARNSARKLAEHAAELVAAVVAACKERSGALHVLTVSHLTVFKDTVDESMASIRTRLAMGWFDSIASGSSTARLIQTWSLGITELGVMLKIDKGVAQLVLDPARCLELSNANPKIDLSKLNPSTTKVVYDGFKIVLEGMANMTEGAPWPWKAIPQTILQFTKLVERSLDLPDKMHDLIREINQLIAMLFNIHKQAASPHQSELTSFVEVFFADMQRIIIRLRVVEKTHPAKSFPLTDRINMIIQDESAKMQRALGNLQTRFVAHTAYTVESISECVTRMQSTVNTTRAEVQFVSHVVQETAVGVDTIRTTTDTTHAVPTISHTARLPGRSNVFNGRDESVNAIVKLICASLCAWIAIMGSGGIGKTSLSLAVMYDERVVGVVRDSRYFVSVEGASDVGAAAQLLAGQLGLPESSDPLSAAITHLETIPRALLIVDNLETLLFSKNAAAQKETERMLQRLAGIPTLTLIITSRGAVPPEAFGAARETFEQISGQPELASERNALDTLLANVDCMPLAVTLLAQLAQLKNPPSQLLQRWHRTKTGFIRSDGDDRESSVDVSIQISLDLLEGTRNGTEGQQLLSICAHLPDGLRPSVFEQLYTHFMTYTGERFAFQSGSTFRTEAPSHGDEPRRGSTKDLLCHRGILSKTYGRELLAASPECGSGVRQSDVIPTSLDQYRGTVSGTFDAIYALSEYAYWTVPSTTLHEAFRQRLDAHPVWLARCLTDVARTQISQDEYALAVVNLNAARKLYATLGDKFQEAVCGQLLGRCLRAQNSLEAAEREFLAAKDTFIEFGDERNAARCAQDLGVICELRDDYAQAKIHFTSARDDFKRCGDRLGAAQCSQPLGAMQVVLGNFSEADAELQSALAEFEALAVPNGMARCAVDLGGLRVRQKDYDSAEKHLATAREIFTRIGDRDGLAYCHWNLGKLRHVQGRLQDATENFSIAEEIYTAIGNQRFATACRKMIAELRNS
ncbi:hypothetical protein BKA62DRAFT_835124 [Auriculariales sp. MPI-PUGE-AT-0066]|nr:hypothetical protein BKA62DRAFT_835124 [Auriculariales sp. MPI-PUGE-AT-0066]